MTDPPDLKMHHLTAKEAALRSLEDVIDVLRTNQREGLTDIEAKVRLKDFGDNDLSGPEEDPLWKKYLEQFKDPMILLLLASAFVSLCMRQFDDAFSISLAIVIVVTVAFIQEYRSEKALEALKKLVPHKCNCIRNGVMCSLFGKDLVPGDIVCLNSGDRVPADMRISEAVDLRIDESSFTGEPDPVLKSVAAVASSANVIDIRNCAFMGTLVRCGSGKGVVICTGEASAFGEIFRDMQNEEAPKTPLQKNMDALGKQLTFYSLCIIVVIVIIGIIQKKRIMEMFTIGVSLAVAAIPEGLPIVVTVTLAIGVMRMAKRRAIVKKLPVVETLGCVNVICSDKTGTLTKNEMTATQIATSEGLFASVSGVGYSFEGDVINNSSGDILSYQYSVALQHLTTVSACCNNADVHNGELFGQPTEGALAVLAAKLGGSQLKSEYVRIQEWPFSSDTKLMMVKCEHRNSLNNSELMYFMKGATDKLLRQCTHYFGPTGNMEPISEAQQNMFLGWATRLGENGLRVLALAAGKDPQQMVFCGLVGLLDPPRAGVEEAVRFLQQSGVSVHMVTGDAEETAIAIAKRIGMDAGATLSGEAIDDMSEADPRLVEARIYYRTSPRHKTKIVRAFQSIGKVVAMTGDGVNDAVALKAADIGIAMGIMGTEVSKEASDMILIDDHFQTILSAMEEGKTIFHNIRSFIRFQLSTSIAALSLVTMATIFNLPSPLNPMQILWINILMDGPPAQSLGVEPLDPELSRKPPRRPTDSVLPLSLVLDVLRSAAIIVLGTLWIFYREMSDNKVTPRDTTMTFTCFVLFDMFNALSCRSKSKSIFEIGFFTNRTFCVAVGLSLLGQLLVIYCSPFQKIFQTEALYLSDIVLLLVLCSSIFWISEISKFFTKHRQQPLRALKSAFGIISVHRKKISDSIV